MIVYAISDQVSSERAIRLTRKLNSDVKIMVRTRLASQVEELKTSALMWLFPKNLKLRLKYLQGFEGVSNSKQCYRTTGGIDPYGRL